jgi:hypothetical protein
VLEDGFDLGHERVVDLERLDRAKCRLGENCTGRGDGVNLVGLVCPTSTTLSRGRRGRNLATVEAGRDERDRDVSTPAGRSFDADRLDLMGSEKVDRCGIAGSAVRERRPVDDDSVGVDESDGEGVLMRVNPGDGGWHDRFALLLEGPLTGSAGALRHIRVESEHAPFQPGALLSAPRPARHV